MAGKQHKVFQKMAESYDELPEEHKYSVQDLLAYIGGVYPPFQKMASDHWMQEDLVKAIHFHIQVKYECEEREKKKKEQKEQQENAKEKIKEKEIGIENNSSDNEEEYKENVPEEIIENPPSVEMIEPTEN